jgi:hypothetical protein
MKQGIQTFFQEIGEAACYALCIVKLAEKITGGDIPPFEALQLGISNRHIYYNGNDRFDADNFYVADPAAFLSRLTGKTVTVRKEANTACGGAADEYIVQCWQREMTGKIITHFRLSDWDSLHDSQTVKYGRLASLRVFKVA